MIILGSGPNRIGQGIEFDYCCVHASMALRAAGYETIMLNCNPETVSTDYDTSDRLYFEPLTPEDLANVIEAERAASRGDGRLVGVIVSLGGQTPLKLAAGIDEDLVLGTSPGLHRPGRGPRAVERALRPTRHPPAPRGHGHHRRRGRGRGRPDRLPGAGAALLRAGRPGHGDRLRRRAPGRGGRGHVGGGRGARARGRGDRRPAGAGRPLPGGRGGGGRRCRPRRHRRGGHLRGDGTRRGGRGPLGRLGLRPAAPDAGPVRHRRARAPRPGDLRVARRCGGCATCSSP